MPAPVPATNSPSRRTKAGLYARVSTVVQTLDAQEPDLLNYCNGRGWEPVIFRDVQTGGDIGRPGLDALLQAVRRGEIKAVVVAKLDRLGRSLAHLALIVEELSRLNVPIICTTQGIDTSADNPVGRLQLGILMAFAEFERSLIRERTIAGLAAARARGAKIGRPVKMTETQRTEIFRLHHEGRSIRAISRAVGLAPSTVWLFLRPSHGAEKGAA
jgi:DNA invertase Pin-like site-specific DNA recombinase